MALADYAERQTAKKQVPVPYRVYMDSNGYWFIQNTVWGTSRGWFQIRILRDPMSGNLADRWRVGDKLGDALYNAQAAFAISKGGTDFSLWSTFVHGTYEQHLDVDYELKTGHAHAAEWDI